MKTIQLLPLGEISDALLSGLQAGLSREFSATCEVLSAIAQPAYALNGARQQYHSTQILAAMSERTVPSATRLLGITSGDLYIPILTFVFGEAQLDGRCAVVSTFRLRQEFYGLPCDAALLESRLIKESVHELGHTLGIEHCDDYNCVMASSHAVEWIDLKGSGFCDACRSAVTAVTRR